MKKLFTAALSLVMSLSLLASCSSSPAQSGGTSGSASAGSAMSVGETKTFKVAIVQQMDHASLDEIRSAIEEELTARSYQEGSQYVFQFDSFSGQNDATVLNQIGSQVVSGGYDAIIPIATLAAQCMANATEGTDIPVVYAAISDPAVAGLEDIDNVTGTSDALNTPFILDMMLTANPDVKTVGLLLQLRAQLRHPHRRCQGLSGEQGYRLCGKDRQHHRRDPVRCQRSGGSGGRRVYPH